MYYIRRARCWLQRYAPHLNHAYEGGHLLYFGLVAFHGAYEIAAGGLAVVGIVYLLTRLEF